MSFQSNLNMPILTGYGILDREFRKKLGMISTAYSDFSIFRQLKMQSKIMPSEQTGRYDFYYFEQADHLKSNATVVTVANLTQDTTPSVNITLSAADHYNSGANSYPIVGNICIFANQVTGLVFSINRATPNAHVVLVKSLTNSTDVQTAAVVGSVVNFMGMAVSERSTKVESRQPRINRINQKIQITRGNYSASDSSMQNRAEVATIDGKQYLHYLGIANTAQTFEFDEDAAMLTGQSNTATVTNAAGAAINTTLGLIPNINANGITQDYYGDVDLPTVQDWMSQIVANYGDGEYLGMLGLDLGFAFQNYTAELGKYDAAYAFFGGGAEGKQQAINFEFTGIKMPGIGISIYVKDCKAFSHSGSLGNDRLGYKGKGVFIPCGSALTPNTNEMQPYMKVRYAAPAMAAQYLQNDGEIAVWEDGAGALTGATNDVMERSVNMISYKALQVFNLRKFMVVDRGF